MEIVMIQKISQAASDLFFMVDNSNYWNTLENNEDAAQDVLLESANQFCELMTHFGEELEPEDVVQDFLERV